jgi:hypothetical protein
MSLPRPSLSTPKRWLGSGGEHITTAAHSGDTARHGTRRDETTRHDARVTCPCNLATAMMAPQFCSQLTVRAQPLVREETHRDSAATATRIPPQRCHNKTNEGINHSIAAMDCRPSCRHGLTHTRAFHAVTYPGPFHPHFSRQRCSAASRASAKFSPARACSRSSAECSSSVMVRLLLGPTSRDTSCGPQRRQQHRQG